MNRAVAVVLLAPLLGADAHARPIKAASTSASSSYPEENGVNYDPKNLADSKLSSVWVEGEVGSGLGSSVVLDLGGDKTISGFRIWNGNWYSADFWRRHNRMKDIEVEFSDGTKQTFQLKDQQLPEVITFSKPVVSSSFKLKYKSVYNGSTFPDTAISELQVLDSQPDEHLVPVSATASTTYPADADTDYSTGNLYDQMLDTMWCEGSPGDGAGEWVELNLGSSRTVSKLRVANGNAYSMALNMKSNRVAKATLSFDDGGTEHVVLKGMPMPQTLSFPSHTTSKVRITINEITRGVDPDAPDQNDLCISEANLLP